MKLSVQHRELTGTGRAANDWIALPLLQADPGKRKLSRALSALDRALGGALRDALASGDFKGRSGETLPLYAKSGGTGGTLQRVLLIGLGASDKLDADALRKAGGRAVRHAMSKNAHSVAIALPKLRTPKPDAVTQALAEGATLGAYRFDAYRAPKADSQELRRVSLISDSGTGLAALKSAAATGVIHADGQNLARDLSNEPGNELPPAALARRAQKVAREAGLKSRVMAVPELEKRGMGGILAVGGGSSRPPRLIVMEHNAPARGARRKPTLCFVGKGVTFDSGGISIKPSASMEDMKHDMSGAAAVVGAMQAVARLRVPFHVVGVIGAAENLPSATAYRPGDVVRAMSGKTIEVLNTDAEGRVVLADTLYYARTEFKPQVMIDLATLTGATQVALGPWASGVFGSDERLVEALRRAGEISGERAWPMPLLDGHREAIKSHIADVKNTGGRAGGGSTAAAFLAAFTGDTPWAHLDIAGTAWTSTTGPCQPKGATGVGVRLLLEWLRTWSPEGV